MLVCVRVGMLCGYVMQMLSNFILLLTNFFALSYRVSFHVDRMRARHLQFNIQYEG